MGSSPYMSIKIIYILYRSIYILYWNQVMKEYFNLYKWQSKRIGRGKKRKGTICSPSFKLMSQRETSGFYPSSDSRVLHTIIRENLKISRIIRTTDPSNWRLAFWGTFRFAGLFRWIIITDFIYMYLSHKHAHHHKHHFLKVNFTF